MQTRARKKPRRRAVTWADVPAWAKRSLSRPSRGRPAGILKETGPKLALKYAKSIDGMYKGWVRTLAREFAPAAGMDPKAVERKALARDRARQYRLPRYRRRATKPD